MSRRNNSSRHGVYQVERASTGAAVLDKRTWEARFLRDTRAAIASDRGYATWGEVPRLTQLAIDRICYKALMLEMIEARDPATFTPTMREDYHKFSAGLLRYLVLLGLDRVPKDITTPTLGQIVEACTVEHGEKDS